MGKPLTVWKTALDQKRPYLGVNDAVRAIKFIIKKDIFDGKIYNVVSSNNTVRDIVDIITQRIPETSLELVDSEIMNQLSYNVLAEKISNLGFKVNSRIETGILDTINLLIIR